MMKLNVLYKFTFINKLMNENFDLVNEPSYVLQQLIGTKLKVDKEFSGD